MAKLGKQKFHLSGSYMEGRTTYRGDMELFLHYNVEKDYFHFDIQEMRKYIAEDSLPQHTGFFAHCDTKDKAIEAVQALIKTEVVETRMIRIKMGLPSRFWKVKNPEKENKEGKQFHFAEDTIADPKLPLYLAKMLEKGSCYEQSGLNFSFERVMKVEVNGIIYYGTCNEKWEYNRTHLSGYHEALVDWSEQLETFLISTQDKIDSLCLIILDYFNAGKDFNQLMERINGDQKLLE